MEYSEDFAQSWNVRSTSKSWKTVIDDVRNSGPVHIVTEAVCPDQYHVVVTGSDLVDTYYIGKTMYQRKGKGRWLQKTLPFEYQGLAFCRSSATENVDPARIRLLAEEFKEIQLSTPVIRDSKGRECREWTQTLQGGNNTSTTCYDVQTHALLHSVSGKTDITYYWNIPIEIRPPL